MMHNHKFNSHFIIRPLDHLSDDQCFLFAYYITLFCSFRMLGADRVTEEAKSAYFARLEGNNSER